MKHRNFTLIELLAVMAIIAILAGLIIGGAGLARRKGAEAKTKARMKRIELALEQYRQSMGFFPQDGSYGDVLDSIKKVTKARQALDDWNGDTTKYKDGFHKQFLYQCPGTHNAQSYDLWSDGSNKTDDSGGGDDITNWTRQ